MMTWPPPIFWLFTLPVRVTFLPTAGMVGQATTSPVRLGTLATGSVSPDSFFFSPAQ